jgi:hypothetical protein
MVGQCNIIISSFFQNSYTVEPRLSEVIDENLGNRN